MTRELEAELLPCPFCGGPAVLFSGLGEHWGHCRPCGASGGASSNPSNAVERWNRRAAISKAEGRKT